MTRKLLVKKKGYTVRKDVKPGRGVKMKRVRVPATSFKIKDRGAPGRGKKVIPPLHEGELMKHGYHIASSARSRRIALGKSVKEDGYRTTMGRVIALRVLFKRTKKPAIPRLKSDIKWLKSEYGGSWK